MPENNPINLSDYLKLESNIAETNTYSLTDYLNENPVDNSIKFEGSTGDVNLFDYTASKYDRNIMPSELGNLEAIREANQGVFDALGRSTANLIGKTGINVVGGIAGSIYGIGSAIANGEITKIWDNSLTNSLDKASEAVGDYFKVYNSADYEDRTLLGRLVNHPIQFVDEFMDTLSFTTGAILTEMATAGLASGIVIPRALKYLKGLDRTSDATSVISNLSRGADISKLGSAANLTRQLATGAAWEASVEARQGANELRDSMYQDALNDLNLSDIDDLPEDIRADIENRASQAGLFTFLTNMALVGGSNLLQFPKIFGAGYNTSKRAGNRIVKEGLEYIDSAIPTTRSGRIGRNIATAVKNPFMEGIVEEGGQSVLSNTAAMYWDRKNDDESMSNVDRFLTSFSTALKDTYTTGEGWYEIGMGMLIGSLGAPGRGIIPGTRGVDPETGVRRELWTGGIAGSFQERNQRDLEIQELVDGINQSPDLRSAMQANYDFLVTSNSLERDLDRALDSNDVFSYNNYRDDSIHSYIESRIKAGLTSDLRDSIEELNNLSPDDFYTSFKGDEANQKASDEDKLLFKTNSINEFKQRIDNIIEATDLVDANYTGNNQDLRDELIYNISTARNIDIRENSINQSLSDLSNGYINNLNLRVLGTESISDYIKNLDSIIKNKESLEEEVNEAKEIKSTISKLKLNKEYNKLNVEELNLLNNFRVNDPVSFNLYSDKILEMLEDSKKLRDRRQILLGVYNNLFTEAGQKKFEELQAKHKEAKQAEIDKQREIDEKAAKDSKIKQDQDKVREKAAQVKKTEVAEPIVESEEELSFETATLQDESGNVIEQPVSEVISEEDSTLEEDIPDTSITKVDDLEPLTIEEKATLKVLDNRDNVKESSLLRQDGLVVNDRNIKSKEKEYKVVDITRKRLVGNTVISLNIDYIELISGEVSSKTDVYNIYDQLDEEGNLRINPNFDSRLQDPNQFKIGDELNVIIPTYEQIVQSGRNTGFTESDYNEIMNKNNPNDIVIAFTDKDNRIIGYLPTKQNIIKRVDPEYRDNALIQNEKVRNLIASNPDSIFKTKITSKSTGTPMFSNNRKSIYNALGDGNSLSEDVKIAVFKEGALMEGLSLSNSDKIKLPEGFTTDMYFIEGGVYTIIPTADKDLYFAIDLDVATLSEDNANSIVRMLQLFRANESYEPDATLIEERKRLSKEIDFSNIRELTSAVEELIYVNNENDRYLFDIDLNNGKLILGLSENQSFDLNDIKNDSKVADQVAKELTKRFHAVKLANFGSRFNQYKLQDGKLNQIRHSNYNDYLNAESVLTTTLQSEPIEGTNRRYFTAQSVIEISDIKLDKEISIPIAVAKEVSPEKLPAPVESEVKPKRIPRVRPKFRGKAPKSSIESDFNEISNISDRSLDDEANDLMNKCK